MSFTIVKNLEQLPSYQVLCKLAEQYQVRVTGNERAGSFSCRATEGDYAWGEGGIRGKFVSHGVRGEFCFEIGKATVTVTDKPFWLPKILLKQKITEGLDTLWKELARKEVILKGMSDKAPDAREGSQFEPDANPVQAGGHEQD